jgi:hypothetical protein
MATVDDVFRAIGAGDARWIRRLYRWDVFFAGTPAEKLDQRVNDYVERLVARVKPTLENRRRDLTDIKLFPDEAQATISVTDLASHEKVATYELHRPVELVELRAGRVRLVDRLLEVGPRLLQVPQPVLALREPVRDVRLLRHRAEAVDEVVARLLEVRDGRAMRVVRLLALPVALVLLLFHVEVLRLLDELDARHVGARGPDEQHPREVLAQERVGRLHLEALAQGLDARIDVILVELLDAVLEERDGLPALLLLRRLRLAADRGEHGRERQEDRDQAHE